jgi:response regulator NasT
VDNEEMIRAFVSVVLKKANCQTFEASNGLQAFRIVETRGQEIDLIVIDVRTAEGDSLAFALAARELLPTVPIILVSTFADTTIQDIARNAAMEFIVKPFSPTTLLTSIRVAKSLVDLETRVPVIV